MYALGIDLGTTFTSAAVWRDGRVEIASLGSRAAVIPSVVLLREDEQILTGESAHRRGVTEPHRVSREFKRRLGDTTPIMLGGTPYSAEALMSRLLRWTLDEVAQREGGPATRLCVSHPANWGPYKKDLLEQAVRLANIDQPVSFTTEPEAAAVFYAHQQRVEPGAVVAVYDLGGGTFDAAVLRKDDTGFEILGQPEGIERLGGIDFDAAVFSHVRQALGGKLEELDDEDPTALAAVARLREECVAAKEALSSDTDVSIPVLLPNLSTEIRLTRAEFEAMVRPTLHSTIEAMQRALRSAGVTADQLHSVLLVGGSSRMPLVAQLVGAELGRPVAVDAHPKHAIALGAALLAGGAGSQQAGAAAAPPAPAQPFSGSASVPPSGSGPASPAASVPPSGSGPAGSAGTVGTGATAGPGATGGGAGRAWGAVAGGAAVGAAGAAALGAVGASAPGHASAPVHAGPPAGPAAAAPAEYPGAPTGPKGHGTAGHGPSGGGPGGGGPGGGGGYASGRAAAPAGPGASTPPGGHLPPGEAGATSAMPSAGAASPPPSGGVRGAGGGGGGGQPPAGAGTPPSPGMPPRRLALIAAAAALLVLIGGGVTVWASSLGDDEPGEPIGSSHTHSPTSTAATSASPAATPAASADNSSEDGGRTEDTGRQDPPPDTNYPTHTSDPLPCTDQVLANERWVCITSAVLQADGSLKVNYEAEWAGSTPDRNNGYHLHIYGFDGDWPPEVMMGHQAPDIGSWVIKDTNPAVLTAEEVRQYIYDYPQVCARIADSRHWLVQDAYGGYTTGNCVPIQR